MIRNFRKLSLPALVILLAALLASCKPPTAKLKVSRSEIKQGDPVTVSWETKDAKTIELNGEKVEKIGAKTYTPKETTTYEVIARRGKKEARDKAKVEVTVIKVPAPTVTLRAEPNAVERGQNSKLVWSTENARIVTITGLGEVPASGEREVSPRVSTTYTVSALGEGGNATASARISVSDPPPPPIAERPRTVSETPPPTPPPAPPIAELFKGALVPVFFALDKSDLTASEQDKLRRAAEWLLQGPHRSIVFRIEGMCDPRGTAEYNLGLGDRRARAARNFLVSLGVETSRIETVSYGLEKATGAGEGTPDSPPSWAHDRRADFIYLRGGEK
jgi:peptidoglycan-associated lipoprotein